MFRIMSKRYSRDVTIRRGQSTSVNLQGTFGEDGDESGRTDQTQAETRYLLPMSVHPIIDMKL